MGVPGSHSFADVLLRLPSCLCVPSHTTPLASACDLAPANCPHAL